MHVIYNAVGQYLQFHLESSRGNTIKLEIRGSLSTSSLRSNDLIPVMADNEVREKMLVPSSHLSDLSYASRCCSCNLYLF